jgi:hypothetical protein
MQYLELEPGQHESIRYIRRIDDFGKFCLERALDTTIFVALSQLPDAIFKPAEQPDSKRRRIETTSGSEAVTPDTGSKMTAAGSDCKCVQCLQFTASRRSTMRAFVVGDLAEVTELQCNVGHGVFICGDESTGRTLCIGPDKDVEVSV